MYFILKNFNNSEKNWSEVDMLFNDLLNSIHLSLILIELII